MTLMEEEAANHLEAEEQMNLEVVEEQESLVEVVVGRSCLWEEGVVMSIRR